MGKRSDFDRIPRDAYDTIDNRVIPPLELILLHEGYLTGGLLPYFAEPCAGRMAMADMVESAGLGRCTFAGDVHPRDERAIKFDALKDDLPGGSKLVITNPPWNRDILHQMISRFASQVPTILLFDAGWMHTKQATQLLDDYCTSIATVGRLKWIPGTGMQAKDDCAWYHFRPDKPLSHSIDFMPRAN
jgi:hypothetical protein